MDLSQLKPSDLRGLSKEECEELADDIRAKIIQTVAKNGGHLSSNLGVVEITLALHRVLNLPEDKLVFDVGHQTYAHKLITGRFNEFDTLRTYEGISGFPMRSESEYDCFEAGHASTSISAALGLARARDAQGQKHHVVAVVGDGALTGGMCYEALNDCGNTRTRMIVILNDNGMSISNNVGALSNYLATMRASSGWNTTKRRVKSGLRRIPLVGGTAYRLVDTLKRVLKSVIIDVGVFSGMGVHYLGPINGNDMSAVERVLKRAMALDEPVLIHCRTRKGYGYSRAEQEPDHYHGVAPFYVESGRELKGGTRANGDVVNERLIELAKKDKRIQVITAAMDAGTCTRKFSKVYPERFFDVGIAEEHAVTMCAGMASGGLRPFFFVYSTFLQRGFDQVLHDVCIQNLPVTLMIDRAGISNEDGRSHQGLYDIAYLRIIPNMTVLAPASQSELELMTDAALELNAPCAIRYPKSVQPLPEGFEINDFEVCKWETLKKGDSAIVFAVGTMVAAALRISETLQKDSIELEIINASTVKPLDENCLMQAFIANKPIFTFEEHALLGGFGSSVVEFAAKNEIRAGITPIAVGDVFVPHGDHAHLLNDVGLSDDKLAERIRAVLKRGENNG